MQTKIDGTKEGARMRVTTRHSLLSTLLVCMVLLWTFNGCILREIIPESKSEIPQSKSEIPPAEAKARSQPGEIVHTVQWSGEYLSLIAKWYTGNSSNWKTIAEANPGLNPDFIRIGQKILIPRALARTEEPMPRSYLSPSSSNNGGAKSPSSDQPVKEKVLLAPI